MLKSIQHELPCLGTGQPRRNKHLPARLSHDSIRRNAFGAVGIPARIG